MVGCGGLSSVIFGEESGRVRVSGALCEEISGVEVGC